MNAPEQIGLTPEQMKARSEGVGASESFDALRLDADLWMQKTRRALPRNDDAYSRLGNMIEPYILGEYELATGRQVERKPATLRDGRLIAHLDARTADRVIDAKWRAFRFQWGPEGSADVPDPIAIQLQQQMLLARVVIGDVVALFARPPVEIFELRFDAELGEIIRAGVDRFWWYVEHDTPPPVEAERPEAVEALKRLYPGTDGSRILATPELEHWRVVHDQAHELEESYKATARTAKAHMLAAMKSASELEFVDGVLLRRKRISVKGYTVADREQLDVRFVKPRKGKLNVDSDE